MFFKAYPPKPETCLHFILRGNIEIALTGINRKERLYPVTLIGQQTTVLPRYNSSSLLNFQIVFQPTAIFRLTGISAFEITNTYIDAEVAFPNTRFVFEALQQAKNYRELLVIADRFVALLAGNPRRDFYQLDAVAGRMIKRDTDVRMDLLARESCLCVKQFKRKFYERAGVNPKTYARIIRFNRAFNMKNANPGWDWLRIATACNYFDYQHLVKDYKNFTGSTPNAFHLQEKNSPECRLGLAEELYQSRFISVPPSC